LSPPLYIGPAGWSYPDWYGPVYPPKKTSGFDPLQYMSCYFNLIEINSTFYRLPAAATAARWAQRVAPVSDFRFTVKAHQEFTHAKAAVARNSVEAFKRSIAPLLDAGRLLCVLLQFPWSFKRTDANRRRVLKLVEELRPFSTAVELRHGTWGRDGAVEGLSDSGATICTVDQPLIGDSLGLPRARRGQEAGPERYFRFHGRNKSEWFKRDTNRDLRYNYLYSRGELKQLADAVHNVAEAARQVIVVLNNHFRGQAVANALELKSMLTGAKVAVPGPLLKAYPRLGPIALPDPNETPSEGWLFDPESAAEQDQ
jgi:uncharacterized protein YecE (DUF72 family)